jgi:predicted dehydrogenase
VNRSSDAARIVALAGGDTERNRELAALGGIETIVPTSAELIGSVDALIVTNRDGALHRGEAEPFLGAGVPVWVDKPLATTVDDAEALVAAARDSSTPLTSYSPVRWVADTERLVEGLLAIGEIQTVTVIGPADPASEHSGIFFYGIHCADVAQRLAPGEPGPVSVDRVGDTVVARYRVGAVEVTLQLVKPDAEGRVPFHAIVVGRHGAVSSDLRLEEGYVGPGLEAFLGMMASGRPPLDYADIVTPIGVLEQIRKAL